MNNRSQRLHNAANGGFTLIEVIVAMAILVLGMLAIYFSMSQSIGGTTRLRDKTIASWIATNRITEIQVTRQIPASGRQRDEVVMAGLTWAYELTVTPIPDFELNQLDVTVSFADTPEDQLASITGFVSAAPVSQTRAAGNPQSGGQPDGAEQTQDPLVVGGFGSGWEPPTEQFGETQ